MSMIPQLKRRKIILFEARRCQGPDHEELDHITKHGFYSVGYRNRMRSYRLSRGVQQFGVRFKNMLVSLLSGGCKL